MTHTTTLVADVHVSKTEALDALSGLLGEPVDNTDASHAVIRVNGDVVVSIEVPKFGEDLPLTIDLIGPDQAAVDAVTQSLTQLARQELSWTLSVVGDGS